MKEFIVEGNDMNGYWYDVYCFMENIIIIRQPQCFVWK